MVNFNSGLHVKVLKHGGGGRLEGLCLDGMDPINGGFKNGTKFKRERRVWEPTEYGWRCKKLKFSSRSAAGGVRWAGHAGSQQNLHSFIHCVLACTGAASKNTAQNGRSCHLVRAAASALL